MKNIVCIIVAVSITCVYSISPERLKLGNECKTETGISDELFAKLLNRELVEDPKVKEQILCYAKKVGFIGGDGEMVKDELDKELKSLGISNVDEFYKQCLTTKATPQDTAFHFSKCFYEKYPNVNL